MNIAVIAANGRSGKAFVVRALEKGHKVRAGVYAHNDLVPHERLTIVQCDATNADDVKHLIAGQDAVVSFIGHVKNSPAHVQTDMVRTVAAAMNETGLQRFVTLTGTGVRFPGDHISLIDRVLNLAISVIDPARIQDGKDHVTLLQRTALDWTVVRVLKLTSNTPRPFSLKVSGPAKLLVSRHEVAQAVLEVLERHSFSRQAPIISSKK